MASRVDNLVCYQSMRQCASYHNVQQLEVLAKSSSTRFKSLPKSQDVINSSQELSVDIERVIGRIGDPFSDKLWSLY